jgi:hypothetical protein
VWLGAITVDEWSKDVPSERITTDSGGFFFKAQGVPQDYPSPEPPRPGTTGVFCYMGRTVRRKYFSPKNRTQKVRCHVSRKFFTQKHRREKVTPPLQFSKVPYFQKIFSPENPFRKWSLQSRNRKKIFRPNFSVKKTKRADYL